MCAHRVRPIAKCSAHRAARHAPAWSMLFSSFLFPIVFSAAVVRNRFRGESGSPSGFVKIKFCINTQIVKRNAGVPMPKSVAVRITRWRGRQRVISHRFIVPRYSCFTSNHSRPKSAFSRPALSHLALLIFLCGPAPGAHVFEPLHLTPDL